MTFDLTTLLTQFEERLKKIYSKNTNAKIDEFELQLLSAHSHPLLAGGKRIRPTLLLLMANALGGESAISLAQPAALAIELIQTYSLVHDDLPCMDDDDFRRGIPTTHKVYGDAKALLVGDGLLTEAFHILSQGYIASEGQEVRPYDVLAHLSVELTRTLSGAAGSRGMVLGQWLDISYTNCDTLPDWEILEKIHLNKTGKLLGSAFEMGLLCGAFAQITNPYFSDGVKFSALRKKARIAGETIGVAFQLMDDVLDVTKSSVELGKTAGKDVAQNKFTAVRILGLEHTKTMATDLTFKASQLLSEIFASFPSNKDNQAVLQTFVKNLLKRDF